MNINIFKPGRLMIQRIAFPVLLILMATLPVYVPDYTIIMLTSILMYVVITLSWVIFSAPTGYMSLASAAFFGIGIYTSAILGKELPLPVVIFIGGLMSFIVALLVGALTLRLRGIYFAIFTFGLVELIKHFMLWWEIHYTGTRGRFVVLVDDTTIYYVILIIAVFALLTAFFIRRSKYGLALKSIGENEEAATHIGINTTVMKVITFAISAAFMGATGAIIATRWTYIDPYIAFNALYSFMPVLMAIFGGMGHLFGPVLGAAVFTYLEEFLITLDFVIELGTYTIRFTELYMLTFGIIMIVTILYLPDGLVGLVQHLWRRISGGEYANT